MPDPSPHPGDRAPGGSSAPAHAGLLLVATPTLEDPNFHRAVVLVLVAGTEGTIGVVLNRANDVPVGALLPGWEALAAEPASMFVGGPVARNQVICLARLRPAPPGAGRPADGFQPVVEGLATLDLNRDPDEMAAAVEAIRVFSGYAGWAGGQLEAELAGGSWFVLPCEVADVFTGDPAGLWPRVLRRQGGRFALYANAPPILSMN